jgi:hypothetical protein
MKQNQGYYNLLATKVTSTSTSFPLCRVQGAISQPLTLSDETSLFPKY